MKSLITSPVVILPVLREGQFFAAARQGRFASSSVMILLITSIPWPSRLLKRRIAQGSGARKALGAFRR